MWCIQILWFSLCWICSYHSVSIPVAEMDSLDCCSLIWHIWFGFISSNTNQIDGYIQFWMCSLCHNALDLCWPLAFSGSVSTLWVNIWTTKSGPKSSKPLKLVERSTNEQTIKIQHKNESNINHSSNSHSLCQRFCNETLLPCHKLKAMQFVHKLYIYIYNCAIHFTWFQFPVIY